MEIMRTIISLKMFVQYSTLALMRAIRYPYPTNLEGTAIEELDK